MEDSPPMNLPSLVDQITRSMALPFHMPNPLNLVGELGVAAELGLFLPAYPLVRHGPRGDGHPVLVIPGMGQSDMTTAPLRFFLWDMGYQAEGWKLGTNLGPTEATLDGLESRLKEIKAVHRRKVSLIGQSLGGLYARVLAHLMPGLVRQVITLGSPFRGGLVGQDSLVYELLSGWHSPRVPKLDELVRRRPPVPLTAVYSKSDGVAPWEVCVEDEAEGCESVEVYASHFGMAVNPTVLLVLADRLALTPDTWKKFNPDGWRRHLFPAASAED